MEPDPIPDVPDDYAPGKRVRLTRPDSPAHFRRGLEGVIRESSWYTPQAPRNPKPGSPPQVPKLFLVVDFPACPANGGKPFGSFLWGHEVSPVPVGARTVTTLERR